MSDYCRKCQLRLKDNPRSLDGQTRHKKVTTLCRPCGQASYKGTAYNAALGYGKA